MSERKESSERRPLNLFTRDLGHSSHRVISQKVLFQPLQDIVARLIGEDTLVEIGALPAGGLVVVVRVERNLPETWNYSVNKTGLVEDDRGFHAQVYLDRL